MSETYSKHAAICSKFYELTTDANSIAQFVFEHSGAVSGQHALFVGGMFDVALSLVELGIQVTAVDYTDEMILVGKSKLPNAKVVKADLRALAFDSEFDVVLVVGRVFTHMITDGDISCALKGCRNALRKGGILFADNYQDSKIEITDYFNGIVTGKDDSSRITRVSTTKRLSSRPLVVQWDAEYKGEIEGAPFSFFDSIQHRAFSRDEFAGYLRLADFEVLKLGDNFDETSFFTVARKY